MKRGRLLSFLGIVLLAAAAGGCAVADTGAFVRLQEDMEAMKREVASLRAGSAPTPRSAAAGQEDLSSIRRSFADLSADQDQIKSDLLALTARTDEAKLELQREISRLNGVTVELGQQVQALSARTGRLEETGRRVPAQEEREPSSKPFVSPPPPASVEELKTPEEMYEYALGLIKNGDTRKGREILNAFSAKYPEHRLMQNVYYWKGETFYAEKDYESAILSFQDVIDKYPGGDKASHAMLKQGLSFQALKDAKNARILYELLLSKYPNSPAADVARQKIAELR